MADTPLAERRYGRTSIALHWTMAALIVAQIFLGWWLNEWVPDHSAIQAQLTTVHISVGLTILLLVIVRIGVRVAHPPPPLPAGMPVWEQALARATHTMFYLMMLALPLSGWLMVSVRKAPLKFWGLPWTRFPDAARILGPPHSALRGQIKHAHVDILIWIILINLALHVAGALKHQFDGRPVAWRMGLGRPPREA